MSAIAHAPPAVVRCQEGAEEGGTFTSACGLRVRSSGPRTNRPVPGAAAVLNAGAPNLRVLRNLRPLSSDAGADIAARAALRADRHRVSAVAATVLSRWPRGVSVCKLPSACCVLSGWWS